MSFSPYDRNPSGIVFFGTSPADKLYESVSTFTYDAVNNSLRLPNGGFIGTQGDSDSISIASNGNVTLSQSLSVAGNLTVNGTTTSVNSTIVTIEDPVIVLGSGAPTVDDNFDRGIAFNYYAGAARSGFFGWDDSSQGFALYSTGNMTANVFTGQLGWLNVQGVSGELAGNASTATTATTLATTRTFSVSGQTLAAAQNFNGSANVTLTTALDKTAISSQPTLDGAVDGTNDFILLYDASTDGLTKLNRSAFITGLGSMSNFTISDGTTTQLIEDSNTLTFKGGTAISFTVSATDTVSGTLNAGVAGVGLAMASQVLSIDFNEFSVVAVASGDSFAMLDSDGAAEQRSTISDVGSYLAGTGLIPNGGGVLSLNVDNSTVEVNADILRIKDAGVTEVKRSRTVAAVSTTSTLSNDINICTAGVGGITVTLPTVATGKVVHVKKVDSAAGTVTVQRGGGGATIDGSISVLLYHQYESLSVASDGTNWHIL
jgi:hypothetical protein